MKIRLLPSLRKRRAQLTALDIKLDALARMCADEREAAKSRGHEIAQHIKQMQDVLQVVYDREPEFRERLRALRASSTYRDAFDRDEPLVSVVIPTYDRGDLLMTRALPSVLGQSYANLEVVIVGDCAPAQTGLAIAELGDPRVRYENLTYRGPYPPPGRELWHVAGIPARNLAVQLARGAWIAPLDDDDAFDPNHIALLLELARRDGAEVAYGRLRVLMDDGSQFPLGAFPPEFGQFGWQGAIFHAGLGFFEMELADALFGSPADWSLCRRMLRAGVRFAMLPELVVDHYQSRFGAETGPASGRSVEAS
jgi:hypothetical protein